MVDLGYQRILVAALTGVVLTICGLGHDFLCCYRRFVLIGSLLFSSLLFFSHPAYSAAQDSLTRLECLELCRSIAKNIEQLKLSNTSLAGFRAATAVHTNCTIGYEFNTRASDVRVGWRAGFPDPDSNGMVLYIGLWDETSKETAQIHTQVAAPARYIGTWRVTFILLEGKGVTSIYSEIIKILKAHGMVERR